MRITVAGEPKEVSTGRECDPVRWNAKANRAKGTKEDIRGLEYSLDSLNKSGRCTSEATYSHFGGRWFSGPNGSTIGSN